MAITSEHDPVYDALRLTEAEVRSLIQLLNVDRRELRPIDHRQDQRIEYEPGPLKVQMLHPGGSSIWYHVRARNISSRGVAFLHGSFCYSGTPVTLALTTLDGEKLSATGRVVRCNHIKGTVHDVAVELDQTIDLSAFVNRLSETQSNPEIPSFSGRILYVEKAADDQQLLAYWLRGTQVDLTLASDAKEAIKRLKSETYDLILTEVWLGEMDGIALITRIRADGCQTPIVVLTADHSSTTEANATAAGASQIMHKPYTAADLAATIGLYLGAANATDEGKTVSLFWEDRQMQPLIQDFLSRLEKRINQLGTLIGKAEDQPEALRQFSELRGTAGGFGFPQLSAAADQLIKAMQNNQPLETQRQLYQSFRQRCMQAVRVS